MSIAKPIQEIKERTDVDKFDLKKNMIIYEAFDLNVELDDTEEGDEPLLTGTFHLCKKDIDRVLHRKEMYESCYTSRYSLKQIKKAEIILNNLRTVMYLNKEDYIVFKAE